MENKDGEVKLNKALTFPQMLVIGLIAAVGTGALFAPVAMVSVAGPSAVLGWVIGAVMYAFVSLTFVELSKTYPEAGGPSRYSLYTHGRFTNALNAFASLIWYIFIPPIEALATVEGLQYIYPHLIASTGAPTLLGAGLGVVMLLLFLPLNYFGVRAFGRSSFYIGIIKLLAYLLAAFGMAFVFFRFQNFYAYRGSFLPYGFSGILFAIPYAMFAFGGIRVVPDYSEETTETKKNRFLGRTIVYTVLGQSLIYILFSVVFIGGVKWSAIGGGISPGSWGVLNSVITENPFVYLASTFHSYPVLIIVLIVSILGPFVTGYVYVGGGARVLLATARSKIMSSSMKKLSETYAVPYWAVIAFVIVGAVVAFISAPVPGIYALLTDAVVAGYLGFAVTPVSMIVSRRQSITKHEDMIPGGTAIAVIAFVSSSLIAFWSGWPSVPYALLILTITMAVFGPIFHIKEHFVNSIWYILYMVFILVMSYIGSDGALSMVSFITATIIVAVVSALVFFPWGIISGLKTAYVPEGQVLPELD
ncbi:amino acid transporter protein related protein [Thermoplasma acidophilum]|uniref:Amino acid transporter protein related protein n=1 Tax=Thermoplasma acidophilum (strain ATCC 25905 / DSM 1728 / JCM 9062 / NBRC 15155 / AMRC-C165) TaxID=273075 RepID=Q9HKH9_THEAC|nr:APC family permease [Thermoplasma acidophilum]CAC11759.1 amino acid transporter protein related protein [Thermoplasma acidophilum]